MIILFIYMLSSSYFLRLTPGVMSQGMGGSLIMVSEGLGALHNPANIGPTRLNFTLAKWLYSANYVSLGACSNDYAIGATYLNYGTIQGYDESGAQTQDFVPFNICLAFGRQFGSFGISIKGFAEKIQEHSFYGTCIGFGSHLCFDNFTLGAKIDNLGKEFSGMLDIPLIAATGLKYSLNSVDIIFESKMPDLELNLGLCYYHENICLLAGAKYIKPYDIAGQDLTFRFADMQLSSGIVIDVDNYQIGYAFTYNSFTHSHQFAISLTP